MKTIVNVYVEKAKDGTYWATSKNAPGVVSAFGDSLEELKEKFTEAFNDYLETAKEVGEDWYEKYQDPKFVYEMDLGEFFALVPELKISAIAKKARINQSLMRQYATGSANASEQRLKQIESAVHQLGNELLSVSF